MDSSGRRSAFVSNSSSRSVKLCQVKVYRQKKRLWVLGVSRVTTVSVSAWMFKRDGGRHKLAPSIINNMAAFTLKLSANLSVRKKKGKTCWLCKQNTFLLFRQNWGRTEVREEQMWRPTRDTGTSETLSDETETDFCGFDLNKAGKYSAPAAETWQENPTRDQNFMFFYWDTVRLDFNSCYHHMFQMEVI